MKKAQKLELGEKYRQMFRTVVSAVLIDPQGLTVAELVEIRKSLHDDGTRLRMLKNRVAAKAAKDTPFEQLSGNFSQMRALVYNAENPVAPAKSMIRLAEEKQEHVKIIGGVLISGDYSETLDAAGILELSKMPSREELIAKLLFLMNAPATNFVRTLNEIPAGLVRTLRAVADSKQ